MTQLVKYTEPQSLIQAVELAHIQKQWCSTMDSNELRKRLTELCLNACDAIGQTNLEKRVLKAGVELIENAIQDRFKTLHIYEIEKAAIRWASNTEVEIKHFSGSNMIKAIDSYVKSERSTYIKSLWVQEEEKPKEYSDEYKRKFIQGLYTLWKQQNGIVTGYVQAFDFLKDLKEIRVEKSSYWMAINAARDEVMNRLKTDQATRTITGIVYNRSKEALELLTEENFSQVMKESQDYNELISEAKKWLVIMHFQDLMINE